MKCQKSTSGRKMRGQIEILTKKFFPFFFGPNNVCVNFAINCEFYEKIKDKFFNEILFKRKNCCETKHILRM